MTRATLCAAALVWVTAALCYAPETGDEHPEAKQHRDYKVVHVFVALCDNKNQGIVPVPASLGNGQDPKSNLYWGAQFGADTFFRRSEDWTALKVAGEPAKPVLARSAFRSAGPGPKVVVFMEAYDGAFMKTALTHFLASAAGATNRRPLTLVDGDREFALQAWGYADMVCFVGHNGLMDATLDALPESTGSKDRPECAVVLACLSHRFFKEPLRKAGCPLLLATTGLMSPEAYTLDAAVRSWSAGDKPNLLRDKAAAAYARNQKCSLEAAKKLFVACPGE